MVQVELGILGSLRLQTAGAEVGVGGTLRRALVARLLVDANRVVPLDRLVDDLWGDGAATTPGAVATVRSYVSRLRRLVGHDRLLHRPPGYLLVAGPDELDAVRFEALVDRARGPGVAPHDAVALLERAEHLWRGPALAEFADLAWARPLAERLDRRRLDARADRVDALLACGRCPEAAAEAAALVEGFPLDERFWELLLVAHYRSGRQAEALRAYQRARRVLRDELGIDPGPRLRAIERALLRHDASLDPTAGVPPLRRPPPSRPSSFTPRRTARCLRGRS
jgi:DNA-binding SARP family transcriptional activator